MLPCMAAPVTQKRFAELMGVSAVTTRRWIHEGMPAHKLPGGDYRIDIDAAKAWIALQNGAAPQPTPTSGHTPPAMVPAPSSEEDLVERLRRAKIAREEAQAHQ